jgi:3-carboxy-cis,cis-muconate cycloisomerase
LSSEGLFSGLFVPEAIREATSGAAWLRAMLDVEAALAAAEAEVGLIPAEAAEAITKVCAAGGFDPGEIGRQGRAAGTPVVPLIAALRKKLDDDAASYVHLGATSQDVIDTAAMLVARRALTAIVAELEGVAADCATLAEEHRGTLMVGRTLMQHALPITLGLKAAEWLDEIVSARDRLESVSLAVQLGGAAGTLAAMGPDGERVVGPFARRLQLDEPRLPWHSSRIRVADLGASLVLTAGALEKIALDLVLLSQIEIGEVAERSAGGRGGSSSLPHKRNAIGSILAIACARRVRGAAGVLFAAMPQELERAAGAWQAEWESLGEALAMAGGAAGGVREALDGLEIRPERMRENLEATRGLLMAESVVGVLGERIGRGRARERVDVAVGRAHESGSSLRDELIRAEGISDELTSEEIDRALDPAGYLGSADAFIDRALSRYREGS